MAKLKDTDFLHISPRIKVMETRLISKEDINRMLNAPTDEDSARIVMDKGYTPFDPKDIISLEQSLETELKKLFDFLSPHMPNPYIIDFFTIKYSYHNLKVMLKAEAMDMETTGLLSAVSPIPYDQIDQLLHEKTVGTLDPIFTESCFDAQELLNRTGDPQLCDIRIDQGLYLHLNKLVKASGSDFLQGYLRLMIDCQNIKAYVRTYRMKKPGVFLEKVIYDGGTIGKKEYLGEVNPERIAHLFRTSNLSTVAKLGESVARGDSLFAPLDLACDNALMDYGQQARYTSFGDKTVIGYLLAKDCEINQIRTVILGRLSKRPQEKITESLRQSYV